MNAPITPEALLAKLKALPPERLGQVADFVEFLSTQEQRRQAGEELRAMWSRMSQEAFTDEIEQDVVAEVRAYRAERRKRGAT
ncbi:MAG: hypothetical protein FJY56_12880 [Betaproteobacteria bacterium]|nr:hypothetical protein [Betaproteobacteria bacterium]